MSRPLLPILLAAALGVAACAQSPYGQGPNPHGGQTVMTGAAAGAALGALLGAAAGGPRNRGGGAAAGALMGAMAGGLAGYAVQDGNQRAAQAEAGLDRRIAVAEAEAKDYRRAADASTRVRQSHERRLAQLDAEYRAGRITAGTYAREAEEARQDLARMRATAREARASADGWRGTPEAQEISAAEREILRNADGLARALAGVPRT
jgi:hypothetical protein